MKDNLNIPVTVPEVLLPANCDMQKWAVVACDQFTSDISYWEKLDGFVGDSPSTLRLILPECYLESADAGLRRENIQKAMDGYYSGGLFRKVNSFIYVKRTFVSGKTRHGIIAAVDLEQYDYQPESKAAIRATEGTVTSRLPARVQIRNRSKLELPHIMVLIDDPENIVMSAAESSAGEVLYNFDLCCGGGHITGCVTDGNAVMKAFGTVADSTAKRFGEKLFALVGDGNHSLAAAKKCYEQAKAEHRADAGRKRYALCEIVNLYDDSIEFEPIHRAIFGVDPDKFFASLKEATRGFSVQTTGYGGGKEYIFALPENAIEAVAFVQNFCDRMCSEGGRADYIHGADVLRKLGDKPDCAAIPLPPVSKSGFTEYIIDHGILPKKTFSMGSAEEKRYYLEARALT